MSMSVNSLMDFVGDCHPEYYGIPSVSTNVHVNAWARIMCMKYGTPMYSRLVPVVDKMINVYAKDHDINSLSREFTNLYCLVMSKLYSLLGYKSFVAALFDDLVNVDVIKNFSATALMANGSAKLVLKDKTTLNLRA